MLDCYWRSRLDAESKRNGTLGPICAVGDSVLLRKGYGKRGKFVGPFEVTDVTIIDGTPKEKVYLEGEVFETATLRNILQ